MSWQVRAEKIFSLPERNAILKKNGFPGSKSSNRFVFSWIALARAAETFVPSSA